MAKQQDEKHDEPLTITREELKTLLEAAATAAAIAAKQGEGERVRAEVAGIMTARTPDESMAAAMQALRGTTKPRAPEGLIPCRSPITDATFSARVVRSRAFPKGRILELLDYQRPEGWDKHKDDGGLYLGPRELMQVDSQGVPHWGYRKWVYEEFWAKDIAALAGKSASYLRQWSTGDESVFSTDAPAGPDSDENAAE